MLIQEWWLVCGGKLASINFLADGEHNCKCGKRPMKPNCCKDKTVVLKANKELTKNSHLSFKIANPKFLFDFPTLIEMAPAAQHQYFVYNIYHPPLFKPQTPIYLLDGVFLIKFHNSKAVIYLRLKLFVLYCADNFVRLSFPKKFNKIKFN